MGNKVANQKSKKKYNLINSKQSGLVQKDNLTICESNQTEYDQIRICHCPQNSSKVCRVLLLGDVSVGKTSLASIINGCEELVGDQYFETVGFEKSTLYMESHATTNHKIKIELYDLAGHERFSYLTDVFLDKCDLIIYVFDLTTYDSFYKVQKLMTKLAQYSIKSIIVGNKCDLVQSLCVSQFDIDIVRIKSDYPYCEISVKYGTNINLLVNIIGNYILHNKNIAPMPDNTF